MAASWQLTACEVRKNPRWLDHATEAPRPFKDLSANGNSPLNHVEMPRMGGLEACRTLRHNNATKHTPIILLTVRGEEAAMKAGLDSGCNEYMLKPVNEEKLVAVLKKYLS
jgi:CheY-like chemotaxis protein